MITNKLIRDTFKEISVEHIKYANYPDEERKYFKRLLRIFKEKLTEEEQLFVFKHLMDQVYFRNIITDPDNIIQIHNIKLRTYTFIFLLTLILIVTVAILFSTNDSLNIFVNMITNIFKILNL